MVPMGLAWVLAVLANVSCALAAQDSPFGLASRPEELYAAQRRTTPCEDGELCHQQDRTPQAPHGHVCQGGCGGRLHCNCGSMLDDHDTKRICSTCVAEAGKRKAKPAEGAGAGPSQRPKKTKGGSEKGSGSRARPDNSTKIEILKFVATL